MNESSITASKALFARYHFHRSPGCTPTTDPTKSDPLVANGTEASATVAEASAPGVETAPGSDRPSERRRGRRRLVPKVYLRLVFRSLLRTRRNNPKEPRDMLIKVAVFQRRNIVICFAVILLLGNFAFGYNGYNIQKLYHSTLGSVTKRRF